MERDLKPCLDVTVVMPAYNRASLITRALDSILNQGCHPQEVIVIDDGSTDDTAACVASWSARTGFPVRIKRLAHNSGAAAARNHGIELARTRYVAFLDSDDEHLPHTLERLVAALDAWPDAVVAFGDATKITPTQRQPNAMFQPRVDVSATSQFVGSAQLPVYRLLDAKNTLLAASVIPTCATCFRRADALAIGGMPTAFRTGEDWLFWLQLSERGNFVFYLQDLALVHRHAENLTHPSLAAETSRQKLLGFAALLDGSAGVTLSTPQKQRIEALIQERVALWRYQASLLGLATYARSLRQAAGITGKGLLDHAVADPRSVARAVLASVTKPAAHLSD